MHTTEAVILKKLDVDEAGLLFTLYTKDYGKMRAIAAGIKKEGAKLKGHLEPLSMSLIRFVSGKNREKLIAASLINFWEGVRADARKLSAAYYIAARIDRECLEGERDDELWKLLQRSFSALDGSDMSEDELAAFPVRFDQDLRECLGYGRADMEIRPEVAFGARSKL